MCEEVRQHAPIEVEIDVASAHHKCPNGEDEHTDAYVAGWLRACATEGVNVVAAELTGKQVGNQLTVLDNAK